MNKVVTINLGGRAYQLEEAGYDALKGYLEEARSRLADDPGKDEIIADLEQSIAEKCDRRLNAFKTVVTEKEAREIIGEMGPVSGNGNAHKTEENATPRPPVKRLYRIREGATFAGVCNGLGAYFDVDVTLVRLIFIILTILTGGAWVVAYILMAIFIPTADSAQAQAAASGAPFTAQELIDYARKNYHEFTDKKEWKEWKRNFKQQAKQAKWEYKQWHHQHRHDWSWQPAPADDRGPHFLAPLFGAIATAMSILWIIALVSLLFTSAIFGILIPSGAPFWITLIILIIGYGIIVEPFKVMKRRMYRGYWQGGGFVEGVEGVAWLVIMGFLAYWLYTNVPQVHEYVNAAAWNVKEWWLAHQHQ